MPTKLEQWDKELAMQNALSALLLFHSGTPWDDQKRALWFNLTGQQDATTKVLCDVARKALGQ
jgi:hypothetical protein